MSDPKSYYTYNKNYRTDYINEHDQLSRRWDEVGEEVKANLKGQYDLIKQPSKVQDSELHEELIKVLGLQKKITAAITAAVTL